MKFEVVIDRVDSQVFVVDANNEEEAKEKGKQAWKNCLFNVPNVLDVEEVES